MSALFIPTAKNRFVKSQHAVGYGPFETLTQIKFILYGLISAPQFIETSPVTQPYLGKIPSHDTDIDMNGLNEYGK